MRFSDTTHNPRIELDTKGFEFSAAELEKIEKALAPLREPVRNFPVADLYITVTYHAAPSVYHVRAALVLSGRTLFTGDHDENPISAWIRCVRKLVAKVTAYKENLSAKPEWTRAVEGTVQEVVPEREPDAEQIRAALDGGDYAAFRRALNVYEEAIRKRAGRWIERYPEFESELGFTYQLDDVVEEVFLIAFETFDQRPRQLRMGQWLEELIDPSVKALLRDPEGEQENIDAVRALREMEY